MKPMLAVALVSAATFSSFADAACQHYKYAELKAMKRNTLEFAYCEAGLESKKESIKGSTARQIEGLNRSRAYSDISDSIANDRAAGKADDAVGECENEKERIGRLLISRKTNMEKLDHECGFEK